MRRADHNYLRQSIDHLQSQFDQFGVIPSDYPSAISDSDLSLSSPRATKETEVEVRTHSNWALGRFLHHIERKDCIFLGLANCHYAKAFDHALLAELDGILTDFQNHA